MMNKIMRIIVSLAVICGNIGAGSVYAENNFKLGDVNSDGMVNAVDASEILKYYAETSTGVFIPYNPTVTSPIFTAGNVNHDADVNALDASLVLGYYAYTATGGELSIEKYVENPPKTEIEAEKDNAFQLKADYAKYASNYVKYEIIPDDIQIIKDLGVFSGWKAVVMCPSETYTEDCKEITIYVGKHDDDCDCSPYREIFLGSGMFDLLMYKNGVFKTVQQAYDENIISTDDVDEIVAELSYNLIYG